MPTKSTRGRGRPAFTPTAAQRQRVSISAGAGMKHGDIALALQIHVDTLRKYFEAELSVGAQQRRMEVLNGLFQAAKKGSSSAAKAYLALDPEMAVPPLGADDRPTPKAPPAGPAAPPADQAGTPEKKLASPLGKKEQANVDARTAHKGTEWDNLLPDAGMPLQ